MTYIKFDFPNRMYYNNACAILLNKLLQHEYEEDDEDYNITFSISKPITSQDLKYYIKTVKILFSYHDIVFNDPEVIEYEENSIK